MTAGSLTLAPPADCPSGFIPVPGNSSFGTTGFCVMKYEAKDGGNNTPISTATGLPWNSSQTNAIARSQNACEGCHLISEAEWMTIATNVMSVSSNWSGGSVGSGYMYNGHVNYNPDIALAASTDDADGLYGITGGTGSGPQFNNRRTLTLTNGEVIWDMAGNVYEWTTGAMSSGLPGRADLSAYNWLSYNNPSLQWNMLPAVSRPSGTLYPSSAGVGALYSLYDHSAEDSSFGFCRSGDWRSGAPAGVLSLHIGLEPHRSSSFIGFRVAR